MVAMLEIEALAGDIAREFQPERIILFGSHAEGTQGPHSDVDLLVILPHNAKNSQIATQMRNRLRPQFPLDLLVRSPAQIQQRLAMGDPFLRHVTTRGKVLYEADHR